MLRFGDNVHILRVSAVCTLLITAAAASGAPPDGPPGRRPVTPASRGESVAVPDKDPKESQDTTIAKCLADIRSDNPEIRKRAVLILGKYRDPKAQAAVGRALKDPVAKVRRAAVVSLTEQRVIPPGSAHSLLQLLGDSDVHIRRLVSSALPRLMSRLGRLPHIQNRQLPPSLITVVRNAFQDADATVRENMLSYYVLFRDQLTAEILRPLMADDDRDVRMLALRAGARVLPAPSFLRAAGNLTDDPDQLIRLHLARSLRSLESAAAVPLLQQLSTDENRAVAAEATLGLLRKSEVDDLERVSALLASSELDVTLGRQLIQSLPLAGPAAEPVLKSLFQHKRPDYRAAALQAYARSFGEEAETEDMLRLLQDSSGTVRRAAGRVLLLHTDLEPATIDQLRESRYPDVRTLVVGAARKLPPKQSERILAELLFDESEQVRRAAIADFASRQLPDWETVLIQSLRDDSQQIRQTALRGLLRSRSPAAIDALQRHLHKVRDARLKRLIQVNLRDAVRKQAARRGTGEKAGTQRHRTSQKKPARGAQTDAPRTDDNAP